MRKCILQNLFQKSTYNFCISSKIRYPTVIVRTTQTCNHVARKFLQNKIPDLKSSTSVILKQSLHGASQKKHTAGKESEVNFVSTENDLEEWDVDFYNVEDAYKNKTTWEIIRALVVFQLCNINYLVENGMQLSQFMQKVFGRKIFEKVMKISFYGHFVAGGTMPEIKKSMARLHGHGVGAILDYAVEEELSEEKAKDLEMDACSPDASEAKENSPLTRYKPHRQFGDRRRKVISARTYFYTGEVKCDENMKIFLNCIECAGDATEHGFAAIKLTALGRPQFLLQFSEVLVKARQLFERFSGKEGTLMDKKFDFDRFENKAERLGVLMSRDESKKWFTWMDRDDSGYVDLLDWNELISKNRLFSNIFQVQNPETGQIESLLPRLSDEEEAQMKRMLNRVDVLARKAVECNVRLMIDAEQTYFQPAISRIAMEMMRKYNKDQTIIMNTYQCYLKDAYDNVMADLALSQRENFYFGLKLVRGAYMEHERERANQLSYEDPIQPTYQDTNRNYNSTLGELLQHMHGEGRITLMAASHNEESVKFALKRMHDLDMTFEQRSQVYFGQLLGMCDYISFPLGHAGHHVFKYVPYGPVREVLPYLYRRAQENRSVLSASMKERRMLRRELWRRVKARQLLESSRV